jgi:hypothetical protein
MAIGTTAQLTAMISEDQNCTLPAASYDFYFTNDLPGWEKKTALVGSGQCVALVQAATGAPVTSLWLKGPKVKGSSKIPVGTAIATFDAEGKYANHSTGNHAALFVSVSDAGIVVVDQWAKKDPAKPSRRTLRFRDGKGSASNDGDQFSVVMTIKIQNHPDKTPGG